MKQLLCLLSLVVILSSCSKSPEQKAKDLIKEEMKKSMNDFSSYEPVEYGKLDSAITPIDTFGDSISYNSALQTMENAKKEMIEFADTKSIAADYQNKYDKGKKESDSLKIVIDKKIKEYKPVFKGWVMVHKFRGKNKLGALVLNSIIYEFDKEITKIVDVTNLGKE